MKTIRLAWKALARFRTYTFINILGLALSLACVLIILRYIHQEVTVNHFCKDLENTYLLYIEYEDGRRTISSNEDRNNDPNFIDPLNDPSILKSTRWINFPEDRITVGKQIYNVKTVVTDSVFLQILPYPSVSGISSLKSPNDAIITRRLAERLFGKENPIGKTMTYSTGDIVTVTGVIGEPTTKSFLDFDLIISERLQHSWSRLSNSLLQLIPGTDFKKLNVKNEKFMKLRCHMDAPTRLQFFPLKDFYFDKTVRVYNNNIRKGNYNNILVLAVVTIALLIIGLFNFINIYTVMMLKRAREFGVKKVYGAGAKDVFAQIFTENFILTGMALCISWCIIEITGGMMEHVLRIPQTSNTEFSATLSVGILILLPLLTSIYPFIRYNYVSPSVSIRSVNAGGHSIVSRVLFLFVQYIITFVLIIVSLFFTKQVRFMLSADLNYTTKDIIQCQLYAERSSYDINISDEEWERRKQREKSNLAYIKEEMDHSPLFIRWEYGENPNQLDDNYINVRNAQRDEFKQVIYSSLSNKYIELFGFQLKEGRLWNDSVDQWTDYKMIINESAKSLLEIDNIETALIQPERRLWWSLSKSEEMKKNPPYQVIGVIKDFKIGHLSKTTPPLFIVYEDPRGSYRDRLMAQIVPGKKQEAIAFLKKLRDEILGEGEFEYSFLEDEIATMYQEDKRTAEIYSLFSIIAILISCLGLFGLSMFDIRQRYREIALRKVNGATLKEIYPLLLKKYSIILGMAFIISAPLSWYIISKYLEGFANKAPISWWLFAIAAIVTAFISLATLIWQIRKAANINPAKVLKGE